MTAESITTPAEAPKEKHKGFGSLDPERRREIARKGGLAAQAKGTGHQWTSETAKAAGTLGGKMRAERLIHAEATTP